MNRHFLHPATLFFLLTLVVALLSWVGSIYGWSGVQSLLSAEGLRWQLRNVGDGFFFRSFFLAISCCWLSGWDSVCIQVLGGCPTSNLSWQKTFPKRKAFVVVESDRWGSLYTGSFVSGFRSMGDSTQYYRRVEEFTLVRRCQLSPFVGAGNNGDNLRIQYRFIPYG